MSKSDDAFSRFRASMVMDFDKWHDGIPYDLAALDEMPEADRAAVARELVAKRELDWRDVEALQRIGTPQALARIGEAAEAQTNHGGAAALKATAAGGWTPVLEDRFLATLSAARLMETSFDRLFSVAEQHPTPRVLARLVELATGGEERERYGFGAFLFYLYGHADEWYGLDDEARPHLLNLSGSPAECAAAQSWLKAKMTGAMRAEAGAA